MGAKSRKADVDVKQKSFPRMKPVQEGAVMVDGAGREDVVVESPMLEDPTCNLEPGTGPGSSAGP